MKVYVKNKVFNKDTWLDDKLFDLGIYDKESFVNLTEKCLEDFTHYDHVDKALHLLDKSGKIGLLVDCDPDGYTSAAQIYIYCKRIHKTIEHLFFHTGKQHGLRDTYEEVLQSDIDLLIIPDASTNDFEFHKRLSKNNIEILILDHHECDKGYSHYATVINNQLSERVNNKCLSGAGVTYKFIQYCDENKYHVGYEDLMDLAALGNISDMMNITEDETRFICLNGIRNIKNKLFKLMTRKFIQDDVNMLSVAWSITPKINALIRLGTMQDKRLLFKALTEPDEKVEAVKKGKKVKQTAAESFIEVCEKVKRAQDAQCKKGVAMLEESGKINLEDKCILIKVDHELDRNLTGLIANKLMGQYARPAIILQQKEKGLYAGSARSPYVFGECENFRDYLLDTGLVEEAQGHACAFGVEVLEENINLLKDKMNQDFHNVLCEDVVKVDYEIEGCELDNSIIDSVARYKHLYGQGFEEPKFLIKNVEIESDYIKMRFNNTILSFMYDGIAYDKRFCSRVFRESLGYGSIRNIKTKCDLIATFERKQHKDEMYYKVIIDKIVEK